MHTHAMITDILSKSHHGLRDTYHAAALYLHYHTCRNRTVWLPIVANQVALELIVILSSLVTKIGIFVSEKSKKCTLQTQKQ